MSIFKRSKKNPGDQKKLAELEKHLQNMKQKEHSVDVSNQVMSQVTSSGKKSSSQAFTRPFIDIVFSPAAYGYAAILATGILIGAATMWFVRTGSGETNTSMISGSISNLSGQGINFSNQQVSVKMLPYQMDKVYLLNFIVDSKSEILVELTFDESEIILKKADVIAAEKNPSVNFNVGDVTVKSTGKTSFQVIVERITDNQAGIHFTTTQDQSVLFVKQFFLD